MTDTAVTRNDEESRYEIHSDGALAGFVRYEKQPGAIALTHTNVDAAFQGQGIAGKLVAGALADVAESGEAVVPVCSFIASYVEKHEIPGLEVRQPDPTSD